jgi:hypothetical protein
MSEFMGPPPGWYEPPEGHQPECNCAKCHKRHIENDEFSTLAESPDFQCCKKELKRMINKGQWCLVHGNAYMKDKNCFECEYERETNYKRAVGE